MTPDPVDPGSPVVSDRVLELTSRWPTPRWWVEVALAGAATNAGLLLLFGFLNAWT